MRHANPSTIPSHSRRRCTIRIRWSNPNSHSRDTCMALHYLYDQGYIHKASERNLPFGGRCSYPVTPLLTQ